MVGTQRTTASGASVLHHLGYERRTAGVAAYTARLHDDAAIAVERLLTDATRRTIAVLCVERDERRCHRQVLTGLAHARGIPVAAL